MPAPDPVVSDPPGTAELLRRVEVLELRLDRERTRRLAAEALGEEVTTSLFRTIEQLEDAQAELIERADRSRAANELARVLQQEREPRPLLDLAARSLATYLPGTRCEVRPADAGRAALGLPAGGFAHGPGVPPPRERPAPLHALAAPVVVSGETWAWLELVSAQPRAPWTDSELELCQSFARDLGAALAQAHAFEQQRESVRRLEELDTAKDLFLSTVSHELRTPLTSIGGYVEMLVEGDLGPLSAPVASTMDVMGRNVHRLRSLVEDLLTMSAVDAPDPEHRQPVELDDLVRHCHGALLPTFRSRRLRVDLELDRCVVLGNDHQLERLVLNLVGNAVKFNRDEGMVHVALRRRDGHAELAVSDSGIGIPDDEVGEVFTRFFRSRVAADQHIQGTGLGLTLVHNVARAHGGDVAVSSTVGVGTTFTVRLPLHLSSAPAPAAPPAATVA